MLVAKVTFLFKRIYYGYSSTYNLELVTNLRFCILKLNGIHNELNRYFIRFKLTSILLVFLEGDTSMIKRGFK